jgi:hypothetical protein
MMDSTTAKKTPVWKKAAIIATMMTFIGGPLTGLMTYINLGLIDGFALAWLRSFAMSVLVMAPVGITMMALFDKLVTSLWPNLSQLKTNLIIGFMMAFVMESVMATMTTLSNIGTADMTMYISSWVSAFTTAIPLGLTVGLIMAITIKPRVQKIMRG